jgi:hypothetical protein
MSPTRAASVTGAGILGTVALVLWAASGDAPVGADRLQQLVAATLLLGTPLVVAASILVHRLVRVARGRDAAERLVRVATAGLQGSLREWGEAMCAELATVEVPRERRRFALGCAVASLRGGIGWEPWVIALGVGVALALGTFAASRASLAGSRAGIMGLAFMWPPFALFAATFVTTLATRSFRSGLVAGGLALVAGLVGMLAVAMAEAARWLDVAGVYLLDGDAPKGGLALTRVDAILDPIAPFFLALFLVVWTPWPVLGAAAGSRLRRPWRHTTG